MSIVTINCVAEKESVHKVRDELSDFLKQHSFQVDQSPPVEGAINFHKASDVLLVHAIPYDQRSAFDVFVAMGDQAESVANAIGGFYKSRGYSYTKT